MVQQTIWQIVALNIPKLVPEMMLSSMNDPGDATEARSFLIFKVHGLGCHLIVLNLTGDFRSTCEPAFQGRHKYASADQGERICARSAHAEGN